MTPFAPDRGEHLLHLGGDTPRSAVDRTRSRSSAFRLPGERYACRSAGARLNVRSKRRWSDQRQKAARWRSNEDDRWRVGKRLARRAGEERQAPSHAAATCAQRALHQVFQILRRAFRLARRETARESVAADLARRYRCALRRWHVGGERHPASAPRLHASALDALIDRRRPSDRRCCARKAVVRHLRHLVHLDFVSIRSVATTASARPWFLPRRRVD